MSTLKPTNEWIRHPRLIETLELDQDIGSFLQAVVGSHILSVVSRHLGTDLAQFDQLRQIIQANRHRSSAPIDLQLTVLVNLVTAVAHRQMRDTRAPKVKLFELADALIGEFELPVGMRAELKAALFDRDMINTPWLEIVNLSLTNQ